MHRCLAWHRAVGPALGDHHLLQRRFRALAVPGLLDADLEVDHVAVRIERYQMASASPPFSHPLQRKDEQTGDRGPP